MSMTPEQMAEITFIRDRMRVSKVVATRSVKTKHGDFFVGMSSAWDTIQEDAGGQGADLIDAMDEGEQHKAIMQRGMTLRQAKVSGLILGMQVDMQAVTHALCGGSISEADFDNAIRAIKRNYMKKLAEATAYKNGGAPGDESEGA